MWRLIFAVVFAASHFYTADAKRITDQLIDECTGVNIDSTGKATILLWHLSCLHSFLYWPVSRFALLRQKGLTNFFDAM